MSIRIAVGELRRMISEAAATAAARAQLKGAVDDLFSAADGGGALVSKALEAWHEKSKKSGARLTVVQDWIFSERELVYGPRKAHLTADKMLSYIFDILRIVASPSDAALTAAEWIRGELVPELAELKKKAAQGGEDPSSPLGRFAFPDARTPGAKVPWEPDTPEETELLNRIDSYFSLNHNIPPEDAVKLLDMYQQGLYSDVLRPPTVEFVYRGMGAGPKWLRKLLKLRAGDPIPPNGTADVSATYRASRGAATSWTEDRQMAVEFAKNAFADRYDTGAEYTLVLVARVSDNPKVFLSGPDGLYKLKVPSGYKKEREALALDAVKIHSIEWRSVAAAEAEYSAKKAEYAAKKAAEKDAKKKGKKA